MNKQQNTKYLGVVLDEHLSWAVHVNHLCRKLSKFIPLLYNVRENMLKENLRFVYNSLIYPVLIYCNVVWGGCCKTYLAPLQVIQRKILRIMSFKNRYDHTAPLFLDFNALTVDRINIYVSIIHVFKCLQNRSNDVFQRYIPLQYQTRLAGANSLIEPDTRSEHSRQSVRWRGSHFWIKLPCDITGIQYCNAFKIHLKKFLINTEVFQPLE